jgi:ABC-type multidrug transport system ATPase subunit/pSer/pThr/pTyr-binding forkhead associated (FHA) protein
MDRAANDVRAVLHVLDGPAVGQREVLTDELLIGRTGVGIGCLGGDDQLSRSHALLAPKPDGTVSISDLDSRHGTWVNGQRIRGTQAVRPGDRIRIGRSTIAIELGAGAATPTSERATGKVRAAMDGAGMRPEGEPPGEAGVGFLVTGSNRRDIPPAGLTIGRDSDNDVVLQGARVSRRHARIELSAEGYFICDLGSANGTKVNGTKLRGTAAWLRDGDLLTLGSQSLRFVLGETTQLAPAQLRAGSIPTTVSLSTPVMRIGRDRRNDLVLDDPNVSRFHTELERDGDKLQLRDLGSRNGTFVDGIPVTHAVIRPDAAVSIGGFTIRFDAGALQAEKTRFDLVATDVSVRAGETTILEPTSLTISAGSFVAIIGGSGAGKTTLLKLLGGVSKPDSGVVAVNREPVEVHQAEIGYLPQDEIVHPALTVRETLRYAAQLRLPDDTTSDEIDRVISRVLTDLDLRHRADARIANLSGGQRKRAGLGTELVSHPSVLFLDEATTGLDPVLERRMMELMRSLARDGRSVVTVTHATRNLDLCDVIVVMGEGGRLCFTGSPTEAREFFDVGEAHDIYNALERLSAVEWQRRWNQWSSSVTEATERAHQEAVPRRQHSVRRNPLRQTRLLAARYLKTTIRDHRNLILLLGQVPLLAAAIALLYPRALWSAPTSAHNVAGLIFLIVTLAIWVGAEGSRARSRRGRRTNPVPLLKALRAVGDGHRTGGHAHPRDRTHPSGGTAPRRAPDHRACHHVDRRGDGTAHIRLREDREPSGEHDPARAHSAAAICRPDRSLRLNELDLEGDLLRDIRALGICWKRPHR